MASAELVSIQELADGVNRWCFEHGVVPASGQAGERITERNIRFYRARGILDPPGSGTGEKRRGFSEKHACQLRAVRLLQARGVALEQIEERLRGRSLEELQEFEREELRKLNGAGAAIAGGSAQENWLVTSIGGEYLLVSRRSRPVTDEQRRQIAAALGVNAQSAFGEK
jgi:DNA-binding transcriptional MerR regulator